MGCDVRKRKPKSHSPTGTQETPIRARRVGLVVDLKAGNPHEAPLFFFHLIPIFVFISVYLSYSGASRESSLGYRGRNKTIIGSFDTHRREM
jgi:hypothetical protein